MQVTLLRDFKEDIRMSMERYANGLWNYLPQGTADNLHLVNFSPVIKPWMGNDIWSMRFARYLYYPLQIRKLKSDVNHIIDHAYGHLLYFLDHEKTIVSVHDLIPLVRWQGDIQGVPKGRKPWLNLFSFKALPLAKHLITASINTKMDLVSRLKCDPQKISVIPYGIDPDFKPYSPEMRIKMRRKYGIPGEGVFTILLSGSQFYKNQRCSLEAIALFRRLSGQKCCVIKVGHSNQDWSQIIRELGLEDCYLCLGNFPLARMSELYNCADCLLFPSLYEGFGWPPLEAMACGLPVVASNSASLPEVIGDAGFMCNPEDIEALANALFQVSTDLEFKQEIITRGLNRAGQFNWKKSAEAILSLYRHIAGS